MTEIRRASMERAQSEGLKVRGYAAVYDSPTVYAGQRERIAPGAFEASLEKDIRLLFDHDTGSLLARSSAGTLRLKDDKHGLLIEADLPETNLGRDVAELLRRGDLDGMSFAGHIVDDETEDGVWVLRQIDLIEVSIVTFPAYKETEVALARARATSRSSRIRHRALASRHGLTTKE